MKRTASRTAQRREAEPVADGFTKLLEEWARLVAQAHRLDARIQDAIGSGALGKQKGVEALDALTELIDCLTDGVPTGREIEDQ